MMQPQPLPKTAALPEPPLGCTPRRPPPPSPAVACSGGAPPALAPPASFGSSELRTESSASAQYSGVCPASVRGHGSAPLASSAVTARGSPRMRWGPAGLLVCCPKQERPCPFAKAIFFKCADEAATRTRMDRATCSGGRGSPCRDIVVLKARGQLRSPRPRACPSLLVYDHWNLPGRDRCDGLACRGGVTEPATDVIGGSLTRTMHHRFT